MEIAYLPVSHFLMMGRKSSITARTVGENGRLGLLFMGLGSSALIVISGIGFAQAGQHLRPELRG